MQRRDFITRTGAAGVLAAGMELADLLTPSEADAVATGGGIDIAEGVMYLEEGKEKNVIPKIRPEILNNPRAVFLIETHVDARADSDGFFSDARDQLYGTGRDIVPLIFEKGGVRGGSTFLKPNFTYIPDKVLSPVTGVITSPDFSTGMIDGLRELGNTNIMMGDRGGTNIANHRMTGIYTATDPRDIKVMMPTYRHWRDYGRDEVNWHTVPDPVVWKKLPTYRPIGDKDNFFINVAKLKNHNGAITTLSLKNLQGAVPTGYGHFCNTWSVVKHNSTSMYDIDYRRHFTKDLHQNVEAAFAKHLAAGFKYWDYEGSYKKYIADGGWDRFKEVIDRPQDFKEFNEKYPKLMYDETWQQRALDCGSTVKPTINIIEGVIGRDGSAFDVGTDYLCNIVIAGLSTFETDAVGSYIMGHDPREVWYTRVAKERGLGECDVSKIDIYWIRKDGVTKVRDLSEITRHRLGCNLHTWAETGKRLFW